ncbi:MAG: nicotinate phosphoribosyltransferase [Deltaproteobacteria bacterium]|nr:nicotinate phosphoribosyltransferase [Deltaproteobacteria bacterium]
MDALTSPLLTDLYQLTMWEAYLSEGMEETAAFEFYVRDLPAQRGFLIASGLESLLSFLENLSFSAGEIAYLDGTGRFSRKLLDRLAAFRFTGDLYSLPEGTAFFASEPLIRVVAPIGQAQLVETRAINLLHFETLIATKAARCMLASGGRAMLVDFGLRRAHGAEAGLLAARASRIAGFAGTATVLAGAQYGIPVFGTMAHSYIEAHDNEEEAFIAYARANRDNVTLLIDTYDPLRGARRAAAAAKKLAAEGIRTRAVRLDSGDILSLSKEVRALLDREGLGEVQIFVSGNIDEREIRRLLAGGAPIDGFGVGTKLDTSEDAPYLECAYKLVEYAGRPRLKTSTGKATLPGRKQVFRRMKGCVMSGDTIALDGETPGGEPLLRKVMENGRRLEKALDLAAIARYTGEQLQALPGNLRRLETDPPYDVRISPALLRLREKTRRLYD